MPDTQDLPANRPSNVAFVYNDHQVTFDDRRLICLTEMWRASGSPENQDPRQWRRKEGATFIADLARSLDVPVGHIVKAAKGGKGGGGDTSAHWQVALAYAKHLSNDFHRYVNEAFREWAEEKADPDLKARRAIEGYRSRGKGNRWISDRLDGLIYRHQLTDALKDQGVHGPGFAFCTDAINKQVLGVSARELRVQRGLRPSDATRDNLTSLELSAIKFAETMAEEKVKNECAHGNNACCQVCDKAGEIAYGALVSMGLAKQRS